MNDTPPLVLIVDDDATIGRVLEDAPRPTYRAQAVSSAQQALEVVREREVAIVLADQRMPGTSGLELLSQVRHLQPTAVGVLMTAHADIDSAIRAINTARVLGFVTKPSNEHELLLVLERPRLAEHERISATPTVIRRRPLPVRRVIGDLSDPEKVILWLDLPSGAAATLAEDAL